MGREGSAATATRRTVIGIALVIAATAAIAVAVVFFFRGDEELSERPFPAYWSELEEGETTERELRARLGPPTRVEGECLFYRDLVAPQTYEFCFQDGVLFHKAAI